MDFEDLNLEVNLESDSEKEEITTETIYDSCEVPCQTDIGSEFLDSRNNLWSVLFKVILDWLVLFGMNRLGPTHIREGLYLIIEAMLPTARQFGIAHKELLIDARRACSSGDVGKLWFDAENEFRYRQIHGNSRLRPYDVREPESLQYYQANMQTLWTPNILTSVSASKPAKPEGKPAQKPVSVQDGPAKPKGKPAHKPDSTQAGPAKPKGKPDHKPQPSLHKPPVPKDKAAPAFPKGKPSHKPDIVKTGPSKPIGKPAQTIDTGRSRPAGPAKPKGKPAQTIDTGRSRPAGSAAKPVQKTGCTNPGSANPPKELIRRAIKGIKIPAASNSEQVTSGTKTLSRPYPGDNPDNSKVRIVENCPADILITADISASSPHQTPPSSPQTPMEVDEVRVLFSDESLPPPPSEDEIRIILQEPKSKVRSVVVVPETAPSSGMDVLRREKMENRKRSNALNLGDFKLLQKTKTEERLRQIKENLPNENSSSTQIRVEQYLKNKRWDNPTAGSQPGFNDDLKPHYGKSYKGPIGGSRAYFSRARANQLRDEATSVANEVRGLSVTDPADLACQLMEINHRLTLWRAESVAGLSDEVYGMYLDGDLPDATKSKAWTGQNGIRNRFKHSVKWRIGGVGNIIENAAKELANISSPDLTDKSYASVWQILDLVPAAAWIMGNISTDISPNLRPGYVPPSR